MTPAPSARPWTLVAGEIRDADGVPVARVYYAPDAPLIVEAVNAQPALKALRHLAQEPDAADDYSARVARLAELAHLARALLRDVDARDVVVLSTARVAALATSWRAQADAQGALYGSGLRDCAEALEAVLAQAEAR